jgi:hypothetical protein
MPYTIEYQEEKRGVITTYWGVVTDEDIIQSGREKYHQREKVIHYRYALTDLSRVEKFTATPDGIQANADISSDILKRNNEFFIAFVMPSQLEYGMGRIWQAYAGHPDTKVQIFKTRSEAEKWIDTQLAGN